MAIVYHTDWKAMTLALDCRMMLVPDEEDCTVTAAVVSEYPDAVAWMTADPAPTEVTGTATVVAPVGTVTVEGTVATAVFVELSVTAKPPTGTGKFNARLWVDPAEEKLKLEGENPYVPLVALVTSTDSVSPIMLNAEAEMVADPAATPVNSGVVAPAVWPG